MNIIDIKIIISLIKKNIIKIIGISIIYSFLFIMVLFLITGKQVVTNIFSNDTSSEFYLIKNESINSEGDFTFDFIDELKNKYPNTKVFPSFIIRIPTMMEISFFGKSIQTDSFIMAYPPEFYKGENFTQITKNNDNDSIGITISNQSLLVLKNFLFSDINPSTLRFLGGKLVFGESSILGKYSNTQTIQKNFHIDGISTSLPLYALAIDIDTAIEILGEYNIDKNKIKLHDVHISVTNEDEKNNIEYFIKNYNKEFNTDLFITDSNEQIRETKEKYENVYSIASIIIGSFILISIAIITELSLQNITYKSKNIIRTLKYSKLSNFKIFMYFFGIFIFIMLISTFFFCMITLGLLYTFNASLLSTTITLNYNTILISMIIFIILFILYYIISLFKKIKIIKL